MSTEALVNRARTICEQNGARFTAIREKVFRLLAGLDGGIGAYELLEQLKQTEPGAKPATVYRALEFLTEQGFIHKIESSNAFLLCHHFGTVTELHSHILQDEFNRQAVLQGFAILRQTIEAHGLCKKCKELQ